MILMSFVSDEWEILRKNNTKYFLILINKSNLKEIILGFLSLVILLNIFLFLIKKSHLEELLWIIFIFDKQESFRRNNSNIFVISDTF